MKKHLISIFLVIVLIVGLLAGNVFASETYSKDKSDQTYYYVGIVTAIPWFIPSFEGFKDACEALGVQGKIVGPTDHNVDAQVATMEQIIVEKPAGILLHAGDPEALSFPARQAMDAKIPVITFDNDISDKSARYGFIGSDNIEMGKNLGEMAAKSINYKGKVAVLTMFGQLVHQQKLDGFKQKMSEYPDIEIVTIEDATHDVQIATSTVHNILRVHEVDVFASTTSLGSVGAARALEEEGKAGDIKVIANGQDGAILQGIEDGAITASDKSNIYLATWTAVHYLYWAHNDSYKNQESWREAGEAPFPSNTDVGVTTITKENVENYKK